MPIVKVLLGKWRISKKDQLSSLTKELVPFLQDMPLLLLFGDLGAGKTTFVRTLMAGLGSGDEVSSPTFSIVNEYSTPSKWQIAHFDLYRLKTEEEIYDIGVEDYLDRDDWMCLIEWPELIVPFLRDDYLKLSIEVVGEDRIFSLTECRHQ